jgi:predicted TIM-barrel fold metal-dependent hydrolase
MIIDVHTHIFEEKMWPKSFLDSMREHKRRTYSEEDYKRYKIEAKVESLIKDMDEAGVDMSVCLPADIAFMCDSEPEISVWKANEYVAEAQDKYPKRIVGFASVDPQRPGAAELIEKGVRQWGLKGVKIYPGNFIPSEERFTPFWKKVEELQVPVLIHQGTDPQPFNLRCGNPEYLDGLLLKFPRLKIIAAHLARGWEGLLVEWAAYLPEKVWADISAWQYHFAYSPWHFLMQMRYIIDRIPNAILLGSDWPSLKYAPLPSHKEWVDLIKNLTLPKGCLDIGMRPFTEEERGKVLGKNAKRLLNL